MTLLQPFLPRRATQLPFRAPLGPSQHPFAPGPQATRGRPHRGRSFPEQGMYRQAQAESWNAGLPPHEGSDFEQTQPNLSQSSPAGDIASIVAQHIRAQSTTPDSFDQNPLNWSQGDFHNQGFS